MKKCFLCNNEERAEASPFCLSCADLVRNEQENTIIQYSLVWTVWGADHHVAACWYSDTLKDPYGEYAALALPANSYSFLSIGKRYRLTELEALAEKNWRLPQGMKSFRGHAIKRVGYQESTPIYIDRHWGPDGPDVRHPLAKKNVR